MSRQLIGTTTPHDVSPIMAQGQPIIEYWSDFRRLLTHHLGPAGETLLSEPALHGTGTIDWYGETTPSDISPEELQQQYDSLKDRITTLAATPDPATSSTDRQFLKLLPQALLIPGPDYLRPGPHGPILIGWGHTPVTERIEAAVLTGTGKKPTAAPPSPPPLPEAEATKTPHITIHPPPPEPPLRRLWGPWQRWLLLFALLAGLTLLLWLLSRLGGWIGLWLCHYPLLPLWLLLLLALLLAILLLALLPWRNWHDQRRVRRAGAQSGILQVILAWDDLNDLDLHLICPDNTRIYFGNRRHAGGTLDHDANARTTGAIAPTSRPVENIVWQTPPPPGLYTVAIDPFSMPAKPYSRFRVTVRHHGRTLLTRRGTISQNTGLLTFCQFRISS